MTMTPADRNRAVTELQLSAGITVALVKRGITVFGALADVSARELLSMDGMTTGRVAVICGAMKAQGFALKIRKEETSH